MSFYGSNASSPPSANVNQLVVTPTPASAADAPATAAILAQMVDRAAQDFGLSGASRQQLYLFAIQATPTATELWMFAAILRNANQILDLAERFTGTDNRFDVLTNLVRQDYHLSKIQEKMIKKLERRFIVTTKTSYDSLTTRTKTYISRNTAQFSLDLYNTDNTVETVVNQFVDKESYQVRNSFRKFIFVEAVGNRLLSDAANRLCCVLGADVGTPIPRYIIAHVAQLRLIAHETIQKTQALEQAANELAEAEAAAAAAANPAAAAAIAATNPTAGTAPTVPQANTRNPRNNTGFWVAVNRRFIALGHVHGPQYNGNTGWQNWEDHVIAADEALFTGNIQFPGEAPHTFMDVDD